jgi:nucleotidyltransferase substrate binding protein (TIGR01987 family)
MEQDIRWEQRLSNYRKAVTKLSQSVEYIQKMNQINSELDIVLDEMIKEGLIQRFEYTHELAWNLMKDYASFQGNSTIGGSRDATREAFQLQIIENGKIWMDMIGSRNKTSHTYNEDTAKEIYTKILSDYFPAFVAFLQKMEEKSAGEQSNLFE